MQPDDGALHPQKDFLVPMPLLQMWLFFLYDNFPFVTFLTTTVADRDVIRTNGCDCPTVVSTFLGQVLEFLLDARGYHLG